MVRIPGVAVALFFALAAPASAGGPVTLGGGNASAAVIFCQPDNQPAPLCGGRSTDVFDELALTADVFMDSVDPPTSGRAIHTMRTQDLPRGMTLTSAVDLRVTGGHPTRCPRDVPDDGSLILCTRSEASVRRVFTVAQPVEWRLTGTAGGTFPTDVLEVLLSGEDGFSRRFAAGAVTATGTLRPGEYAITLRNVPVDSDRCDGGTCTLTYDVRFEVGNLAAPVAITGGPPPTTRDTTATFAFAALDPPPGRYECRVDGAPFTPCTSPHGVGPLPDGEHVFAVRYAPDGEDAGPATERRWTIDASPPGVTFTSTPSAEPDTTLTWTSEPGATFVCSLDGMPAIDCSPPHRLVGLAPGPHTFSVVAVDAAGNTSEAAVARWNVAAIAATPPPVACAAPAVTRLTAGALTAVARESCFSANASTGLVTVNGIPIRPRNGARIELRGGTLRTTGPVTIELGRVVIPVNAPFTFDETIPLGASFALGLLPAAPELEVEFTPQDGGSATVTVALELPDVFRGVPGNTGVEGLELKAGFKASNDRGGSWSVSGRIAQAWLFGRVHLKDLAIAYDDATGVFSGSVGIALASDATLTAAVELGPDGLIGPLRRLSLQASGLDKHIGHGIFLQRLGASMARQGNIVTFGGNGGVSLGPQLDFGALFQGEAISLDGEITLSIPTAGGGPPFTLAMRGVGKVLEFELAEARVTYTPPLRVDLGGRLGYAVAGAGIEAEITDAWAEPGDFNLEARGRADLFGFLSGRVDVVVSTTGMAACFADGDGAVGFGKRWNRPLQVFADACDVGPFRRAAQAAATRFTVARGTRVKVVDGPAGLTLDGPGAARTFRVDHDGRTTYALLRPRAGRWTASAAVRIADERPAPRITARVRRGVLRWRASERVTLVERAGRSSQVIARGRAGARRFTPLAVRGRHTIEASPARPLAPITVARYTHTPQRLTRPRQVKRRGRTVRWRGTADRYALAFAQGGRVVANAVTRRPRARLPRGRVTLTIVPLAADGRTGPAYEVTYSSVR